MSTIEKIIVRENKALKLNNVLIREIKEDEFMEINRISYMMESYIKSKSNAIAGPMINYSTASSDTGGELGVTLRLMVQLKNIIHNVESPYELRNQIRVGNCLFARFHEREENLHFVYSKLQLHAFENNIKLKGDSYTVFVENKEEKMIADVFMQIQKGDTIFEDL